MKKKIPKRILELRTAFKKKKEGKPVKLSVVSGELESCYCCHKKLSKTKLIYIGKDNIHGRVYRCKDCTPGSPTWMEHQKDNEFYKYYLIGNQRKEEQRKFNEEYKKEELKENG